MAVNENRGVPSALVQLRQDHTNFAFLLDALEREVNSLAADGRGDAPLMLSIVAYFEGYPAIYHHPAEDVIYGHLLCHVPTFGERIFALLKDHEQLAGHTGHVRSVLEITDIHDPAGRRRIIDEVGDFIADERRHMSAEEQSFFPNAARYLTTEQWAEVGRARPQVKDRAFLNGGFDQALSEIKLAYLGRNPR
ncbi:MAG: hemerythrin domain-containing protein [Rhodospirillaceae bacterium]|nr:hemerythrin domain-containing protein [Rhodospirillaceae bacterium]